MMIKLAFFDIDGTLIGHNGIISKRTFAAINTLRSNGILVALATGRPFFGAKKIAEELDIDCPSLFSSGAVIINPRGNKKCFEASIPEALIYKCVSIANNLGLYTELYSADAYFIEQITSVTAKHTEYLNLAPQQIKLTDIMGRIQINKIVVISDTPELEAKHSELIAALPELCCLCSKGASHPEILFNNVTSPQASRKQGFFRIIEPLGVRPEEVISFGDSISDLDFIELSGIGVAMPEAPEEVKRKAQLIAETAAEDGVAKIIEQLLLEMG